MIRVDVLDEETGDADSVRLSDGPEAYVVICGPGCEVTHETKHANGTRVITIKPTSEARRPLEIGDHLVSHPCDVIIQEIGHTGEVWGKCTPCRENHVIDKKLFDSGRGPWKRVDA